MPLMRNRFNEEVEIPDSEVQRALASGYTYATQSSGQTGNQTPPSTVTSSPIYSRLEGGEAVRASGSFPNLDAFRAAGYIIEPVTGSTQGDIVIRKPSTQAPSFTASGQKAEADKKILDAIAETAISNPIPATLAISPQLAADYLNQAKSVVEPEYAQYFQQGIQDLQAGFKQIGEDLQTKERQLESQYGTNLENIQEQAAQRGLTFSTKREGAERSLAASTQAAIDAGRREAERRALNLGQAGERELGTSRLPQIPGVEDAPTPILNIPGQYTFAKPNSTRSLFTPTGNTTGELEYRKKAAVGNLYNTYITGERELRGLTSA